MNEQTKPRRDTTVATEASKRTFARRRAERAMHELREQGYEVPGEVPVQERIDHAIAFLTANGFTVTGSF